MGLENRDKHCAENTVRFSFCGQSEQCDGYLHGSHRRQTGQVISSLLPPGGGALDISCNFFGDTLNKCLLTADRKLMAEQSSDDREIQHGDPIRLIGVTYRSVGSQRQLQQQNLTLSRATVHRSWHPGSLCATCRLLSRPVSSLRSCSCDYNRGARTCEAWKFSLPGHVVCLHPENSDPSGMEYFSSEETAIQHLSNPLLLHPWNGAIRVILCRAMLKMKCNHIHRE